jgi:hypothetical protein
MAVCANCGTNNVDNTKFCVTCGSQLGDAPSPESWRTPTGDLGTPPPATDASATGSAGAGGYAPQTPPSNYPTYTPQQPAAPYQQQAGGQQQNPIIPAIISLFLPGIGLVMVPNKQGLGIGIFAGYVGLTIVGVVLTFVVIGLCLLMLLPLVNIAAAIHSYDEAAKVSNGQFKPILFK